MLSYILKMLLPDAEWGMLMRCIDKNRGFQAFLDHWEFRESLI